MEPDLLLASIRAVCGRHPRVSALDHVLQRVDDLLFPSARLPLPRCVAFDSARLFLRVLKALESDCSRCKFEKRQQMRLAMQAAAQRGQLWMAQQLYLRHPAALTRATALAAGASGHLPLIQWVHETKRCLMNVDYYAAVYKAFEVSASRGDIEAVQWLVRTYERVVFDLSIPAGAGHIQVTKWIWQQGRYRCRGNVADEVAKRGDLEMMQFLVEHALVNEDSVAPDLAAEYGHLELVKWLAKNEEKHHWRFTWEAMNGAAANGYILVVRWLHENDKAEYCSNAMDNAAEFGHLEVLQWLNEHRYGDNAVNAMDLAAMNGHLEVVQWLHANAVSAATPLGFDLAAEGNHLDVVQWLHENLREGCTTQAMDLAAKRGHIEMVKWLHHNRIEGCTDLAMDQAAANGHLEVVEFLHENRTEGCTKFALSIAAGNGDMKMVKWLLAHKPVDFEPEDIAEALEFAARSGSLDVVKCLHTSCPHACCPYPIAAAAASGHLKMVQWFHENYHQKLSPGVMSSAAENCQVEVMRWLYNHSTLKCPTYAMMNAFATGNFDMLQFLDITAQTDRGFVVAARTVAARHRQTEIMQWLTDNYSDVR
ncbi:ankyrin-like protein [Phytophthora cinnamomi]|uniref:ankyrin-like protein n=1 Tax=Phytophthora cinnamomi TaxID=4785 RepID=UPI003559DEC7|nr:ankyrin-like protein [Phytophthora cinnamomi]